MKKLLIEGLIKFFGGVIIVAGFLFVPAGTLKWTNGIVFMCLLFIPMFIAGIIMYIKNPELLKMVSPQLSKMMGGKNIDPEIMMKSMEKIMWIFSIPGKIKRFMLSWRGICFIIFIIAIFYGLFKRK